MILNILKRALSINGKENNVQDNPGDNASAHCDEAADIDLKETIYDIIKSIRDPEKPSTLEDLHVVAEEDIFILHDLCNSESTEVRVEFNPTVPHCSLATLIGLCIRVKLQRCLPQKIKLDIFIKKGTHDTEHEINKQVNDKERIAAAMENEKLKELVEECIAEDE